MEHRCFNPVDHRLTADNYFIHCERGKLVAFRVLEHSCYNGFGEPAANHQRCGISRNGVRKRNCYCFRKRSGELFLGFRTGFSGVHSLACQLQHLYCDR